MARKTRSSLCACSFAALVACPAAALAQARDAGGDWHVSITPYLWLAGVKGDVGAAAGAPPTPIDARFPDVFDHLTGAAMFAGDVRYGSFGLLGDYVYVGLGGNHSLTSPRGNVTVSGSINTSDTGATLAGFYRAYSSDRYTADLVAGARYTNAKISATVSINNLSASGSSGFDRWDPIIGARGTMRTGERGSLFAYGDLDPFDSKIPDWQVLGGYAYSFNKTVSGSIAYRVYGIDLSRNGFSYDVTLAGPVIGVSFRF